MTNNLAEKAIDLYHQIRTPNDILINLFFTACAHLRTPEALKSVKTVLSTLTKSSLSNPVLLTSLLDALMKCGDVRSAQLFFDRSTRKVLSMYGAMMKGTEEINDGSLRCSLLGYTLNEMAIKAVKLFYEIEEKRSDRPISLERNNDHVESDWIPYICIVNALSKIGDLSMSEAIAIKIPTLFLGICTLQNALIDMWVSPSHFHSNTISIAIEFKQLGQIRMYRQSEGSLWDDSSTKSHWIHSHESVRKHFLWTISFNFLL